jgi:uncharacterized membrane protein YqjE
MDTPQNPETGLFGSLKGMAATGIATVRTRIELLSVEIQEEKLRFLSLLLASLTALFLLQVGVVLAAVFITVAFWEGSRLLALGMLTLLFLGGGGVATLIALGKARHKAPPPLQATLDELSRDLERLREHQRQAD